MELSRINNGATEIKMAPGGDGSSSKRKHEHTDANCQNQLNRKQVFQAELHGGIVPPPQRKSPSLRESMTNRPDRRYPSCQL